MEAPSGGALELRSGRHRAVRRVLLAMAVITACAEPATDRAPDIVLVALDTTRADVVGASRRFETDSRPADPALEPSLRALGYLQWDEHADPGLRGVTRYERDRVASGYSLYTNDRDEAYLDDLDGHRLHTWRIPEGKHCEHALLLPGGDLIAICSGRSLVRLGWDSAVEWELPIRAHHDLAVQEDGTLLVLEFEPERLHRGRLITFDAIVRVSSAGEVLGRWSTFEHLDGLRRIHGPLRFDRPPGESHTEPAGQLDYYHTNSIQLLPPTPLGRRDTRFRAGNLLVCLRNADLLVVLDQETFEVVWSWGMSSLDRPHMPRMLPDGHILVFDNGTRRDFSRVLEIDPVSEEVVWQYPAEPGAHFYSKWRGCVQRLGNGNTLVCESERGRVFEVTVQGEIVWEFWNPEFEKGRRHLIYRLTRLPPSLVEPLLASASDGQQPLAEGDDPR